jgi:outer membrane protein assembly factor BamB
MKRHLLFLGAALLLAGAFAPAADWPQFRGPERNGVSQETGLLKTWPEKGPALLWSFKEAGLGFSSFAVVDGKAYTLGTRGADEIVLALDAEKGTELWHAKIGPIFTFKGNIWGDGPRGTPTVAGTHLYALGGQGELLCLDVAAQGKEVWRKNLIKDFDGEMMTEWGYSESPLVDGNLLICTPGGPKGTLAALDKQTGAVVWRSTELTNKAPYSSPVAADIHGVRQYVQTSYIDDIQGGVISGFAPKGGKVLWSASLFKEQSYLIAPTPIVQGDLVYDTSTSGCHLFQISAAQQAKELYPSKSQKIVKNGHGGVILVGGHIYGHTEPSSWVCQDFKSGKRVWLERNLVPGKSGSLTSAAGLLYLYSDEGEVGLAEASPGEKMNLLSSFKIPARSQYPESRGTSKQSGVWSHPVIANGRLLLRDSELIFCYDIRDKK